MPRVETKTKIRLGAERSCGRCGHKIEPGEKYRQWSFRYGGTRYRCMKHECRPRPSDLTQSKMAAVYSAQEEFEDNLESIDTIEALEEAVDQVVTTVQEVKDEYEEAAEPFGYQGENQERADELDSWISDLETIEYDEDDLERSKEDAQGTVDSCPL